MRSQLYKDIRKLGLMFSDGDGIGTIGKMTGGGEDYGFEAIPVVMEITEQMSKGPYTTTYEVNGFGNNHLYCYIPGVASVWVPYTKILNYKILEVIH